jgi:hypothetical protein
MTLSRRNWLVRFAFFGAYTTPRQTTLCGLFWNAMLRLFVCAVLGGLLFGYGYMWVFDTWDTFLGTAMVVGLLGGAILIGLIANFFQALKREESPTGVISETLYAIKHKVCPIIRID